MYNRIFLLVSGLLLVGVNLFAAGDLQVNGKLSVGTSPNTAYKIDVNTTTETRGMRVQGTGSVDDAVVQGLNVVAFCSSGDCSLTGFLNQVRIETAAPTLSYSAGAGMNSIQLRNPSIGTTTVPLLRAMTASINLGGPNARTWNVANVDMIYSAGIKDSDTIGSGVELSVNNFKHINIADTAASNLIAITNQTGMWIDKQSKGTTNYGIVLNGDGAGSDIVFGSANNIKLYANAGDLFVKDAANNVTQLGPHDPVTGEWIFYSRNVKTGKTVRVNMEKLVKAVEKLTGEKFLVEAIEEIK
jgi:hypothetical protein